MTTLRIEHEITDYDVWKAAFDRFAGARSRAGVRAHCIRLPQDDPRYLLLDLEFDDDAGAEAFAAFLRAEVWSSPQAAPGLAGAPRTRVLDVRDCG